jgi:Cys-rich repeat protein
MFCQPTCDALGEAACLARADCEAIWGGYPGAGDSDKRAGFLGCKPVGCAPVACTLYCENGFARDATGCQVCACADGPCTSDADCQPGQACLWTGAADCAGADCGKPFVAGTCQWVSQRCHADADCRAGESCVFLLAGQSDRFCDPSDPACGAWGVCQVVSVGCQSDAECGAGERCEIPSTYCGGPDDGEGGGKGGCIGPTTGTCVPATCRADADCRAGESCVFLMVYPVCDDPTSPDCGYFGTCQPAPRPCKADQECPTGESCQPDPTDPCNDPAALCFAPGATICLPIPPPKP